MKILLIQPPIHPHSMIFGKMEPYALQILAAGIKNNKDFHDVEVKIIDLRVEKEKELVKILGEFKPNIVGITGITIDYPTAMEVLNTVKQLLPRTTTVVGGHHATMCSADFLLPPVDFIVKGPGEKSLQKIITETAGNKNFESIPNIIFQDKGQFIINPKKDNFDEIKNFPIPDRTLTQKYRKNYKMDGIRYGLIVTSVGCPNRCHFCDRWKANNGKFIAREPEDIVEELFQIPEKVIFFGDDHTFGGDMGRMEKLCELIEKRGIKKLYDGYSTAKTIVKYPELFKKWGKIGLFSLTVGFEDITNEGLKKLNKNGTVEINEKANEILLNCGIRNLAHILILPDFDAEDFKKRIDYTLKLGVAYPVFTTYTPLPGTQLYEEKKGDIIPNYHPYCDLAHPILPTKLPFKEFYRHYKMIYRRNYSIKRWLVCQIKKVANFVRRKEIYPKTQTNAPVWYTIPIARLWLNRQLKKAPFFIKIFGKSHK